MTAEEKIAQLEAQYRELDGKYQSLKAKYDILANEKDEMGVSKIDKMRATQQAAFYKRMYDISAKAVEQTQTKVKLGTASELDLLDKLKEQAVKDAETIAYLRGIVEEMMYVGGIDQNVLYSIFTQTAKHESAVPVTDEETKKRIRSLRESGLSIRQIANTESVSVGLVHKVLHQADKSE